MPDRSNFRVADNPGVDRLRQHCDVFILQWIGWKGWLCGGPGAKADIFQNGERITAALRTRPWLALGWGYQGRRLSTR